MTASVETPCADKKLVTVALLALISGLLTGIIANILTHRLTGISFR